MRLLPGSIEEVEHADLGLVSSWCVHSILKLLLIAHLYFGIIVEDDAALDKLALGTFQDLKFIIFEIVILSANEVLPDFQLTSSNGACLACADDIGVGKVLSGCHFLHKQFLLLHFRDGESH